MLRLPKNCIRLDENRLQIQSQIPATIFANEEVPIDDSSIDELIELLQLQETVDRIYKEKPDLFIEKPYIEKVSLSPDFHKGSGIPIGTSIVTRGFAIPQAVGNDINCGVRIHKTSLQREQIVNNFSKLEPRLRHLFFEGGRNIPFSKKERFSLLSGGLSKLLENQESKEGLWTKNISNFFSN